MAYDAPTCLVYEIRDRDDHMDEALLALAAALRNAHRPEDVRTHVENARRHLVAFNNWSDAARPVEA